MGSTPSSPEGSVSERERERQTDREPHTERADAGARGEMVHGLSILGISKSQAPAITPSVLGFGVLGFGFCGLGFGG